MKVLIRCDGDSEVGIGHAMRCLALAEALKDNGDDAIFAACSFVERMKEKFHAEGFGVRMINEKRGTEADASKLINMAKEIEPSWIITDGYVFSEKYQRRIKEKGLRLLCIDDLASSKFIADIVLNQNPGFTANNYFLNQDSRLLLGTQYVLLRREFRIAKPKRLGRQLKNILVTMGGSDPFDFTGKILEALSNLHGVKVTVLLGPANRSVEVLKKRFGTYSKIVVDVEKIASYMQEADLAIHAAGTMSWELAYLGVPSISFVLAENQKPIAAELEKSGFSCNLGRYEDFSPEILKEKVVLYSNQPLLLAKMSDAGRCLVDGRGVQRVIAELKR